MVKRDFNIKNIIIGLSLLLYFVALPSPMCYDTTDISNAESTISSTPCLAAFLGGIIIFPFHLIFLYGGTINFTLIWVFNIVYYYNIYVVIRHRSSSVILKLINIVSVIMIAGLYFNHSQTLGFDVDIITYVGKKGIGYFLWCSSLFIVFLWNIVSPDSSKRKHNKLTNEHIQNTNH